MELSSFSSLKWFITVGVNPGYDLYDQKRLSDREFASLYSQVAQEVENETAVYISCVFFQSTSLYKEEWGCPPGGEYTITLSGSCNTAFNEVDKYCDALKLLASKLKERLRQSTILLEIMPMESYYYVRTENE